MRIASATKTTGRALATLGALAALGAGGVAMSGCGASATLDPIARAAEVSSQQGGARFSLTTQFSSPALPGGLSITAHGSIDEHTRSGEMSMDLSGIPGAAALSGSGSGTMRMIFQYPVIYVNAPFLAGQLPEGKTWMKLDLTKAAQAAGVDLSQLSSFNQDPTQFLEYLRASSGGVLDIGTERVDGVPTTHYHTILQLSNILSHLPESDQSAAKAELEKLGNAGGGNGGGGIPVDVWVDGQGRVRRIEMTVAANLPTGTAGAAGAAAGVSGTITMDFSSYGPIPPIAPPPAGEVFDASSIAAAGLGGGQSG